MDFLAKVSAKLSWPYVVAAASASAIILKRLSYKSSAYALQGSDISNQVVIVTGGNAGLGLETAALLAGKGARVILGCRNQKKADEAIATIKSRFPLANIEFIPLELADIKSVAAFTDRFLEMKLPLHALILNAGVTSAFQKPTKQGIEGIFGINHFGHFVLTYRLLDVLRRTSQSSPRPSRVVVVSSQSHRHTKRVQLDKLWKDDPSVHGGWNAMADYALYAQSKLANVQFANELHRRYGSEIDVFSLHPGGFVATSIVRGYTLTDRIAWVLIQMGRIITRTPDQGAATSVYCAVSPSLTKKGGGYYHNCASEKPTRASQDPTAMRELWEQSVQQMERFLSSS